MLLFAGAIIFQHVLYQSSVVVVVVAAAAVVVVVIHPQTHYPMFFT